MTLAEALNPSAIALEAAINRMHETSLEYRAERDSAREQARLLQKAIDDADLSQLLSDLDEYLGQYADADGDSEGFHPNKAMQLQSAVNVALDAFGWNS